jgi:NAD(P)-dependent dehydrogenase (short-subunit alcohol dehydrogenase family)
MHIKDLFSLDGRVAVVTGGTERLGYYSAQALLEAGATVIVTSRSSERAKEAAARLSGSGPAFGLAMDVTVECEVAATFQTIRDEHGGLDVVVNNSSGRGTTLANGGYAYDHPEDQPLEHWDETLRCNLTSTFLTCKHGIPFLRERGGGSLINMSSVSSLIGRDRSVYANSPELVPNTADYTAAKAGVIGLTMDLAAQVGRHNIRVNALLPGGFRRDSHPEEFVKRYSSHTMLGRMGEFESDLKGAVVFLASEASRYVTGQTLTVDGGFSTFR